mmetsp:Transcript_57361/g.101760  ORF Transcript_57361/g.101760 Transcript_57361/m.101760 type:complete len:85 (-) Transcript_57361:803-1057(-)
MTKSLLDQELELELEELDLDLDLDLASPKTRKCRHRLGDHWATLLLRHSWRLCRPLLNLSSWGDLHESQSRWRHLGSSLGSTSV